jgi:hypothetical protein
MMIGVIIGAAYLPWPRVLSLRRYFSVGFMQYFKNISLLYEVSFILEFESQVACEIRQLALLFGFRSLLLKRPPQVSFFVSIHMASSAWGEKKSFHERFRDHHVLFF